MKFKTQHFHMFTNNPLRIQFVNGGPLAFPDQKKKILLFAEICNAKFSYIYQL